MLKPDVALSADELRRRLHYDPITGIFTRKVAAGGRAPVGAVAGSVNDQGYVVIFIDYKHYYAHRLAWLYMTGAWPTEQIDHKTGLRSDNRWDNLRAASPSSNQQNQRRAQRGTRSGLLGASWCEREQKFTAQIKVRGVRHSLGQYNTAEEAHSAYVAAKRCLHEGCTI